jgi:hypothetical protein
MQAVDSNSLNMALEKWFKGLDVDRDGTSIFEHVHVCETTKTGDLCLRFTDFH